MLGSVVVVGIVGVEILASAVIEIGAIPELINLLVALVALLIVFVLLRRLFVKRRANRHDPDLLRAISDDAPVDAVAVMKPPPVDWTATIKSAEAASDHAALAGLYLSFARAEIGEARPAAAAELLRSSVRAAAKTRNAVVQADARLELAELARAEGDLTTACEHWQIARGLFHELKQQESLDGTEQLMRKHGCPTDWVLNDF